MYFFEIKQIENIATEYFDIIGDYFKGFYKPGVNKYYEAERINSFDIAIQTIILSLQDLEDDLNTFWEKHRQTITSITQKTNIFKVIYCGNPSPLDGINFIKKTALYLDSLFIEDPISFLLKTKPVATERAYLNQMIKHAFNLLDMKKLFYGEGSVPLLIIFPTIIENENRGEIRDIIHKSGDEYFKMLFDRDFINTDDVFDYLSSIESVGNLISIAKNKDILFPDTPNKVERILALYNDIKESWIENDLTIGRALGYKIYGQFLNMGNQVYQAQRLSAQIVFDRREYWDLYKWDIGYIKQRAIDIDSSILNSMQLDNISWLENIDIDKFNLVRNEEEVEKLRSIIRRNIYTTVEGVNEEKVIKQAISNLEEALSEHSNKLSDYSQQLKRKLKIDSIFIVGGTVASIPATLGLSTVVGGVSTLYGIYDYISSVYKLNQDKIKINKTVMGVLFDAREQGIRS
ncbi:hypothetical protein [Sutcliffiella sp. NC1]|uniref:hypothetical protein n=1 Tax=Sutcliffiella sp. NC1 TaxID=3004096 RepID=UPI0022DD8002|nr:hypothetical protein [Sutcliffiella sp. NC1]WBL15121.1 hypothetical protein O1A01_25225 [Sutcliffiella sp. NC1]